MFFPIESASADRSNINAPATRALNLGNEYKLYFIGYLLGSILYENFPWVVRFEVFTVVTMNKCVIGVVKTFGYCNKRTFG
jgi:hypothetical protein